MPDRSARYTPLAQDRTRKTVPLTVKVETALADQIEDAAHNLGIPRHHVLKAALRLGTPLAIAELTAQTSSTSVKE